MTCNKGPQPELGTMRACGMHLKHLATGVLHCIFKHYNMSEGIIIKALILRNAVVQIKIHVQQSKISCTSHFSKDNPLCAYRPLKPWSRVRVRILHILLILLIFFKLLVWCCSASKEVYF